MGKNEIIFFTAIQNKQILSTNSYNIIILYIIFIILSIIFVEYDLHYLSIFLFSFQRAIKTRVVNTTLK